MRLRFVLLSLFLVTILGILGTFLFVSDNVYLLSTSIYVPRSLPVNQKEAIRIANSVISVYLPEKRILLCRAIHEGGVLPEQRHNYSEEYLKKTDYYDVVYRPIPCCLGMCAGGWGIRVLKSNGGWTSAGLL